MFSFLRYKFILFALLASCPAIAQSTLYNELQCAYLYNFAKYIEWPTENVVFTIGVLGESGVAKEFESKLKEKKVRGRVIEVKEITSLDQLPVCQIIYVSETRSKDLTNIKAAVVGKNLLIVTQDDLIKKGACISFVIESDRLRFKLSETRLAEAGLVASEGLLKLAILQ